MNTNQVETLTAPEREEVIQADVDQFLAEGGKIEVLPPTKESEPSHVIGHNPLFEGVIS